MKYSLNKLAIDYTVSSDKFILLVNQFESMDFLVRQWSDETSPYHRNASVKDGNGEGIFIGYHVKRQPPLNKNGEVVNALRIQFNPNKISKLMLENIQILHGILSFHHAWGVARVDVAFDFNVKLENIFIISRTSRKKQPIRYDTTEYYGKRESDGYLKVYDKALEMNIKGCEVKGHLTRVEYTYKPKGKVGRDILGLLIDEDLAKRYHILNIESIVDEEKATLQRLAERRKSSLSKKQREELVHLITNYEITFDNVDFKMACMITKLFKDKDYQK